MGIRDERRSRANARVKKLCKEADAVLDGVQVGWEKAREGAYLEIRESLLSHADECPDLKMVAEHDIECRRKDSLELLKPYPDVIDVLNRWQWLIGKSVRAYERHVMRNYFLAERKKFPQGANVLRRAAVQYGVDV